MGVFPLDDAPPTCKFAILHCCILLILFWYSVVVTQLSVVRPSQLERPEGGSQSACKVLGGSGSSPAGDVLDVVSRRNGGSNCPNGTVPTAPLELLSPAKQGISAPSLCAPPRPSVEVNVGFPLAKNGPKTDVAADSARHATGSHSSENPHGSSGEVGHTGPTLIPPKTAAERSPPRPGREGSLITAS